MAYDKTEILDKTAFDAYNPCRTDYENLVPEGWTGTLAEMIAIATFSIQDIVWGVILKFEGDAQRISLVANFMYDAIVAKYPNRSVEMQHYRDNAEPEKSIYKMVATYLKVGSVEDLKAKLIEAAEL